MNCPSDITVIAKPGRPSEVVSWKIEVDDNSIPVDPEAKVTVHSSHVSPHNFTIGRHYVQTTAADNRGNKAECWFLVIVRDLEPPTCSFCPSDIVKEANSLKERVTWKLPICSDNSHLPPIIRSNRQNGDIFGAPGKYKIQYTVKDFDFKEPNIYTGCSFMITLKRAKCPKYPPPKNGALVCLNHADDGSQIFCQVACKHGTDFVTNPSVLYACPASGEWLPLAYLPNTSGKLPWPDCAMGAGPSTMKTFRGGISEFFYNANQKPSEVERELKDNFLKLAQGKLVSPFLCKMKNYCKSENVRVYV
ncbi:sushi, von Willebrand factor type A, EGF and pentraxin domain-containing protein 1-like [Stylophora pistillata]|nr:sushi, von Willebrand factor type A, EGF and pentraxin domain-containing protein 1-like [Stylophora pistillata]